MSTHSNKGTALITGASTGIGSVYADRLAKRGYDLILVARSLDKLNEVANRIQSSTNRKVETLQADLTIPADVQKVVDRLATDSSITALVNNAGIAAANKLLESDPNYLDQMIQLNVTALTRLALAAAPAFVARANGIIINIGSIVALAPELLNGTYSGTKAYVQNFSTSLKNELAGKGVTVQVVLPGATATPLWEKAGVPIHTPSGRMGHDHRGYGRRLAGRPRSGRVRDDSRAAQCRRFRGIREGTSGACSKSLAPAPGPSLRDRSTSVTP